MLGSSRDCEFAQASTGVIYKYWVVEVEARCHLRTVHVFAIAEMTSTSLHRQENSSNVQRSLLSNKHCYPNCQDHESVVPSSKVAVDPVSYSGT